MKKNILNRGFYNAFKKIKFALLLITVVLFSFTMDAPKHKGLGNVKVIKTITQNILGKNVGYVVTFKNCSSEKVDALKWKAFFYDNFDEYKGSTVGKWSSGNFISPMNKGERTDDVETAWIKDASKVFIQITKVHYVNGTSVGK
jgi:hypothetical protein